MRTWCGCRGDRYCSAHSESFPVRGDSGSYTMRACPLCRGRGVNPVLPTHVCPRCNGERKVPR